MWKPGTEKQGKNETHPFKKGSSSQSGPREPLIFLRKFNQIINNIDFLFKHHREFRNPKVSRVHPKLRGDESLNVSRDTGINDCSLDTSGSMCKCRNDRILAYQCFDEILIGGEIKTPNSYVGRKLGSRFWSGYDSYLETRCYESCDYGCSCTTRTLKKF